MKIALSFQPFYQLPAAPQRITTWYILTSNAWNEDLFKEKYPKYLNLKDICFFFFLHAGWSAANIINISFLWVCVCAYVCLLERKREREFMWCVAQCVRIQCVCCLVHSFYFGSFLEYLPCTRYIITVFRAVCLMFGGGLFVFTSIVVVATTNQI